MTTATAEPTTTKSAAATTTTATGQDLAGQQQQLLHLNWSNFKTEFSGKPDKNVEVHLLCI